ncbi:PEK protein kinase [Plasmodium fragile]|uniref:Eukaryotic translation initiation factor 2-alpha kinase PK4 n=1 Tax=Plasmodium fragile TaxID=5857 RepID=A0A0D9QFQ6_PLAFR|nr:PEK protein kinase [Plasmodium fragile]KJP85839.1 PEK protein kinase [Plasmodium fragile]
MSYYNYSTERSQFNDDDERYDHVEMIPGENSNHGNGGVRNDLYYPHGLHSPHSHSHINMKNVSKGQCSPPEDRRNKFSNNFADNYMLKKKMNETILTNIKNIFEKMVSIERLTNMDNYKSMKNKIEQYHHVHQKARTNGTIRLHTRSPSPREEELLCTAATPSRRSATLCDDEEHNDVFKPVCEQPADSYCSGSNSFEYYHRGNTYGSNNSYDPNLYEDENYPYSVSDVRGRPIRLNNVNHKIPKLGDTMRNWEEFKSENADGWLYRAPAYGVPPPSKSRSIFKRMLREEIDHESFKGDIPNSDMGNTYENIIVSKNGHVDHPSDHPIKDEPYHFNRAQAKYPSAGETEKENFIMCKKDEDVTALFSNQKRHGRTSIEAGPNEHDIIIVEDEQLNNRMNVFPGTNNLENKNILFPYEQQGHISNNQNNITKYERDKYFYGQYKYDETIFIYDLIVLDTSGFLYKVSTDGTYYWKHKVVKNIQDHVNFDEDKKGRSEYQSIRNETRYDLPFEDMRPKNKHNRHDNLKRRAMKKLHYKNFLDLRKTSSSQHDHFKGDDRVMQDGSKRSEKKKNYHEEKLKRNKNITKRLLSNYSGDLFYINENNEAMPLNINIKDVVNNSPFKSPLFPNIVFMGSRHSSIVNLDYETGEVIKKYDESLEDTLVKKGKKTLPNRDGEYDKINSIGRPDALVQNENAAEWGDVHGSAHGEAEPGEEVQSGRAHADDDYDDEHDDDHDDDPDYAERRASGKEVPPREYQNNAIKDEAVAGRESHNNSIMSVTHGDKITKPFLDHKEGSAMLHSEDAVNEYFDENEIYRYTPKSKYSNVDKYDEKNMDDNEKYILKVARNNLRERKKVLIKKLLMSLNRTSSLSRYHHSSNLMDIGIMGNRIRKRKKKKRRRKTERRQLQISMVQWMIKAVDEKSLKQKWITTWVDVGSIFITDSQKQDSTFINSLIEIVGNKLILRPLEMDKMIKTYSIAKNVHNEPEEGVGFLDRNGDARVGSNVPIEEIDDEISHHRSDEPNDRRSRVREGMNQEGSNVKSKIFIFSDAVSSVFALSYKRASNIFTLNVIMKQNSNMFPGYDNVKGFSYNALNFKKENTLLLPFSSSDFAKNHVEKTFCNFDENINYGKKLLHRLNNISVSITSIEKEIRYLLSNIIFVYDRNKKIPINYIYKMKGLIREYQKTKEEFLYYLPGMDSTRHLSYSPYSDADGGRYSGSHRGHYGSIFGDSFSGPFSGRFSGSLGGSHGPGRGGPGRPIHICEYINKFIDMYFEENEICFDYCSMLNIWDKIFNNYISQDDCLLLSNLYRVIQNAFAYNHRDFNLPNDDVDHMISDNANFLVKRRRKNFAYSRSQELKEVSTLKYKKGWYWSMFYAVMLIFVVPFVFIYRIFRKKKNNNNSSSKVIMKKKKMKDYDDYARDQDLLKLRYRLLHDERVRLKNALAKNNYDDLTKMELNNNMKREIASRLKELEQQPTLIDILAKHARDSDSDSKFYDINEGMHNLHAHSYWDGSSKYSLPSMSIMSTGRTKSRELLKSDSTGTNMFYMHRRRAASQDVTYKQSFVVKKRIRSSYKLGNKYHKKNYTDNEKDKKHNHLNEKHINEKDFDKSDFINFLTNYNKKFMKKNTLVDHLLKMNKTKVVGSKPDERIYSKSSKEYDTNSDHSNKDENENSHAEDMNNSGKKLAGKKYLNEENKTTEEKKNKSKYTKLADNGNDYLVNMHKQSTPVKSKLDNHANNNEIKNNKSASARNLSIIQRSHIPYDAPLADFLENGRFMRTFENISLIGQGGFGSVYKVSHRLEPGSPTYAVKFIYLKVSSLDNVSSRRYFREIAANRDIYSKHVVRYYTWWCEEPQFLPMHVMPKEIQNLVKKNKDSFKKMYSKNNDSDSPISYEKLSSWERKKSDLKNFKKVIKKKNERSLTFYSDNDGLNSKRNENKSRKRYLSDKNFSDSIYTNANAKNKKKKKKKKKKIIYMEKQNGDRKGRNEIHYTAQNKFNIASFNSSFQEYDPFGCGYLSEEDRDLVVFADNDEPSVHVDEVAPDEKTSPPSTRNNDAQNRNDTSSGKRQMAAPPNGQVDEEEKTENEHPEQRQRAVSNEQSNSGYDASEKNAHRTKSPTNENTLMTNARKKYTEEEPLARNEPFKNTHKKDNINNKNKEKIKNEEKDKSEEELANKENAEKIKSYKKKIVAPEFSIVLLLQMELCKGYTLRKWLDRSTRSDKPLHFTYRDKNMNHPLEFDLFKQLIKGLKDIHSRCFIHRDLKPENIFVDPDTYTLKIGDLGLVRFIEEKKREKDLNNIDSFKDNIYTDINHNTITSQISLKGQIIGTPGYTAPEGGALCDEKADIYSAALILLELLCPRFNTIMERYKRLNDFRNYYAVPDYVKVHLNPWYILMLQMSKPNPAERPSAADLYSKIKVLLDPHLTDFAFSFNDVNNDSAYVPSGVGPKYRIADGNGKDDNGNALNGYKTNINGSSSTKTDKMLLSNNVDDKNCFNKNSDTRNGTTIENKGSSLNVTSPE